VLAAGALALLAGAATVPAARAQGAAPRPFPEPAFALADRSVGPVRIEVVDGRAQLVTAAQIEYLVADAPPLTVSDSGHLTVRASSRVRLTWSGRASVLVHGPAALEWRAPDPRKGADDASNRAGAEALELAIVELGELDVEVRRGTLQLSLPESWRATLRGVAVQLTALPSGAVEFVHHAGPPIELEWTGERSASRPPVTIPAGSSVRLARPRLSPQEPTDVARREPWPAGADEWPWRAASETAAQRAARLARPLRTNRPEGWHGAGGAGDEHWVSHVEVFEAAGRARLLPVAALSGEAPTRAAPGSTGAGSTGAAPTAGDSRDSTAAAVAAARRARGRLIREERANAAATSAQEKAAPAPPKVTIEPDPPEPAVAEPPREP
jgi:hypothetical protein